MPREYLTQRRRDVCVGVTVDKERYPNRFYEGGGKVCTSYEAGEAIATKSVSWHDQDGVYELQRSALTCFVKVITQLLSSLD